MLTILLGLLAMHHLTFSITGHGHAAVTASTAHQHVRPACHPYQTDPATCPAHGVVCCATTLGKGGPTSPTPNAPVAVRLPSAAPPARGPDGVVSGRAPPDPISLQVLRM